MLNLMLKSAEQLLQCNLLDTCSWQNMPFYQKIMLGEWEISLRLKEKKGPYLHTSPIQGGKGLKYKY